MDRSIEEAGRTPHPWLGPVEEPSNGAAPPPGWKSDEENWQNIQGFLATGLTKVGR